MKKEKKEMIGIVDSREPNNIIKKLLKNGWSMKELPVGDYITGEFIFERKTHSDLIASLNDKRYKSQLARMLATELKIVYILEGDISKGFLKWTGIDKKYSREYQKRYIGVVSSLLRKYGVTLIDSSGPSMTAELMIEIGKKSLEDLDYNIINLIDSHIRGVGSKRFVDIITYISAMSNTPWRKLSNEKKIYWLKQFIVDKKLKISGVGKGTLLKMVKHYEQEKS